VEASVIEEANCALPLAVYAVKLEVRFGRNEVLIVPITVGRKGRIVVWDGHVGCEGMEDHVM